MIPWLALLGLAALFEAVSPGIAIPADRCQALPSGSLSRMECERQEGDRARREERAKREEQESKLGTTLRGTTLYDYTCPGGNPNSIVFLSGGPGETIEGSFLNAPGKTVQGVRVNFDLIDNQNRLIDRVSASLFPETLGPGETGKFRVYLPHRNEPSRPWDCFRVIVTDKPPEQIQVR